MNKVIHAIAVGECDCGDFGALYPFADDKFCKWCIQSLTK